MTTTQILLWFTRNDNSILVNPNIGAQNRPFYHAVLILQKEGISTGAICSRYLALLIRKEKLGLLEGLVLEVLEEWLRHNVT
jgi:hypothetical protein